MLSSEENRILSLIDGQRVYNEVANLVEGGEKISGDEAEQKVASLIRDKLHMIVDSSELEGFPVTTYVRGKGTLEVISPVQMEIPCEVNPCGSAGSGELVLVDGGLGKRRDYQALGLVSGKAALVSDSEGLAMSALEAKAHGVRCLIYHFPPRDDDLICVYGVNTEIPALSVSNDSAAELRSLIEEHGEVRIRYETDQHSYESTSYNVVGDLTGWRYPKEIVYVTGHHDAFFDGANDNLASVALLLEMAKVLSQDRPERTVRFISFGSEETGVSMDKDALYWDQGSTAYSVAHERTLSGGHPSETPICILNGEITGYSKGTGVQATPELLPTIEEVGDDLGGLARLLEVPPGWSGSDHLCFHTLGVPSAQLSYSPGPDDRGLPPYMSMYHTPRDDMEHVFPEALESSARAWLLMAWRLANGGLPPISADRLVDSAVRGLGCTDLREEISERLDNIADAIDEAGSRGDRLSRSLALARTVNRHIYGCQFWSIHPKFDVATTALDRLAEARRLVDDGGDAAGVAALLGDIPTSDWYQHYSDSTTRESIRTQKDSPVLSRISAIWLELDDLWSEVEKASEQNKLLKAIDKASNKVKELAEEWAEAFARDLEALG